MSHMGLSLEIQGQNQIDIQCKLPKSCNERENEISAFSWEAMRLPHKGRDHPFCVHHILLFLSEILEHTM